MRPSFRRGLPERRPFEYAELPDSQKRDLCETLLSEHGIDVRHAREDELVVACTVADYHRDQDRNPTGALNWDKLTFHCLGCGAGGGLLWYISELRGCTPEEAREWLDGETGLGGQVLDLGDLLRYFDALYAPKRQPPPIPTYSARTLDPWQGIHPYLTEDWWPCRGIALADAERFRCGYAEEYVVARDPQGTPTKVSERIILPHFWQGSLVGWQSRRLADDGTPKFLSSPDFPKDQTIFNYDPRAPVAVVAEAMLSTIKHDGVAHFESTFGASITDRQKQLLARHRKVVLWLDNDNAGWAAIQGLWRLDKRGRRELVKEGLGDCLSRYTDVWVVDSPYVQDPADMRPDDVAELIKGAVPYLIWEPPEKLLCYRCGATYEEGHSCP